MKLDSISVANHPPITRFEVGGLSDVVVLAGPNGVGKSRLLQSLLQGLSSPGHMPGAQLTVSATCAEERNIWKQPLLDTRKAPEAQLLAKTLQKNQRRGSWKSSAVYFDSTRQFTQIRPISWSWAFLDPTEEMVGWNSTYAPFLNRYEDTIHSIYRMLGYHRQQIATRAIQMQREGATTMDLDFPDPLEKFKQAFSMLLSPKVLADIDVTNPRIEYKLEEQTLAFDTLSSGEKEVLSVTFDLILRNPSDCIILFDEPELHLHPELSFRLLKTLQTVGARNQFILCTHSPDIITASIEHSVILVSRGGVDGNQGILVKPGDENVVALRELGQSLGIIALGRKIVLIEGVQKSLDRDTYGAIIQGRFPSVVLAPSGSRQTIVSFSKVTEEVLNKTIWGVDFFMLADRDNSLPEEDLKRLENESGGRLRFLPRYHIENYFLDEVTIADSFTDLVSPDSWLRDPTQVKARLREITKPCIATSVNLWLGAQLRALVGDVDVSAKRVEGMDLETFTGAALAKLDEEARRVDSTLDAKRISEIIQRRWAELDNSLKDPSDRWKDIFPGKIVVGKFCSAASINLGHFQSLYISSARRQAFRPFEEVIELFKSYENFQRVAK
jgi:ABC-type cobalamin/Fe3+-siderophores transport system ATPase subunit